MLCFSFASLPALANPLRCDDDLKIVLQKLWNKKPVSQSLPAELFEEFRQYVKEMDQFRDPETAQKWIQYKNGTNHKPTKFDLSTDDYFVYESAVINIRKGDTVAFDNQVYKLGNFLGAGNQTHIYELAGYSDRVIRIPFLTDEIFHRIKLPRLQQLRSSSLEVAQALKKKRGAVKVFTQDSQGRFLIVEKVNGSQNADDFLLSINDRLPDSKTQRELSSRYKPISDFSALTPVEQDKVRKLTVLMKDNYELKQLKGELWFNPSYTRQYVWDENNSLWRVVDAEN